MERAFDEDAAEFVFSLADGGKNFSGCKAFLSSENVSAFEIFSAQL
ncbi:MAG: hypothetical protein IJ164_00285 [Duodenibacillus sp.]|nr:hypothetical protein [Duodenibacillus sp.]